jgi:hypothetical protein
LKEYVNENITEDYIRKLAGEYYDYTHDIRLGRMSLKSH